MAVPDRGDGATAELAVTAVICTCDRHDLLENATASLLEQDIEPSRREIVIVDNSTDRARAEATRREHAGTEGLVYLVVPPRGLSDARNVALEHGSAPYVAFLDDDAVASPCWLSRIVEAFEDFGEEAGIVGGRITPLWDRPRPVWLNGKLPGLLSLVDWGGELRIAGEDEWVAGANIAFRAAPLKAIGGFATHLGRLTDPRILLGNEEVAVIRALRAKGYRTVYAPEAEVAHRIPVSRMEQSWFRKRAAWQAVSDFLADPDRSSAEAAGCWRALEDQLGGLDDGAAMLDALAGRCESGVELWSRGNRVYQIVTALLAGIDAES